jgi:hypothetical protein
VPGEAGPDRPARPGRLPGQPTKTNELIVDLVEQYNTGWVYSAGLADYAIAKMREATNEFIDTSIGVRA